MSGPRRIPTIPAEEIRIVGARPLRRPIHRDPRGFLVETLRSDDGAVDGARFAMSYVSVTVPGEYRDRDRWHVHRRQTDRFVVPMGEMLLALFDGRDGSPTAGRLEVVRLTGAPFDAPAAAGREELATELVPIPPGVRHVIGNRSDRPFVLVNFPTELYSAEDEGRVPFSEVPVPALGAPFDWDSVAVDRSDRTRGPAR